MLTMTLIMSIEQLLSLPSSVVGVYKIISEYSCAHSSRFDVIDVPLSCLR